ncbi:MAG: hypothetical protein DCC65_17775 [Planctomycetota bacterium]|nr:MAG: hypothetical protein DCC65_17775 [Planctomycetota bacterium]
MKLYRLHLRPRSPWRTPWQADTLTGALCATAARVHGADFLRKRLIEPMLAGSPPFVLSDAFPGDLLPLPVAARLGTPPADVDRKALMRGRWLARNDFLSLRASGGNGAVRWDRLLPDSTVFVDETTRHNTLARDSDASLEDGGLFSRSDTHLRYGQNGHALLTLYFRVPGDAAADLMLELLHELSLTGFGADVATGRGQFDIAGGPEPDAELDAPPNHADAVVVLSTFQPAPGDPVDGLWEAFPKFGKLGPDLGLADVRKHTVIMFRPGACFRANPTQPFLGRALPMNLAVPTESASTLRDRGIEVIHPAFGLAVPAGLGLPEETPS